MPSKKIRRHGSAPANWQFRAGRPAWIPSPSLRRCGWRRLDLKDADGAYLSEGASIDLARAVNQAVDAWRAGELVPAAFANLAPAGAAAQGGRGLPVAADKLSIGALIDAFVGSPEFAEKARSTQADYRQKLKRFVDVLAGYVVLPGKPDPKAADSARTAFAEAQAKYADAVAQARADSVFVLAPEEGAAGIEDALLDAYRALRSHVGDHQAAGVLTVVSLWLTWCRQRKTRRIVNWAKDVKRATPAGRIRPLTWDEIDALVEAADRLGAPSIGDSVILGVDLSWSQGDRLALTWPQIKDGRARTTRLKTGNVGETAFLEQLAVQRIAQIRERQAAMAARPTHVLWCETTNAPWNASHYKHTFAEIRAVAAKACPSVLDATDQDLRDTAVTVAYDAGLELLEICSRTLHTPARAQAILDAHYGKISRKVGDRAKAKLEAYLKTEGVGR